MIANRARTDAVSRSGGEGHVAVGMPPRRLSGRPAVRIEAVRIREVGLVHVDLHCTDDSRGVLRHVKPA